MSMFYSKSTGGFYDDSIHEATPPDAVAITDAQWQALMVGQAMGQIITSNPEGNPVLETPPGPTLAQAKTTALSQVDTEAEVLRGCYITANSGQVATYIMKYNEASTFKAAGYEGTVPALVQSEVSATGETAQAAADNIIAQYTLWTTLAASIETVRRTAKVAINASNTVTEVQTAVDTATAGFAQIKSTAGNGSVQ